MCLRGARRGVPSPQRGADEAHKGNKTGDHGERM